MYPDPLANLPRHVEAPAAEAEGPSTLITIAGLLWAAFFGVAFFFFDALESITGRDTSGWTASMCGIFGPQVILGLAVMMTGRSMSLPLRALFILAALGSGALGIAASTGMEGGQSGVGFMVISTAIAVIPQLFGWWLRPRHSSQRKGAANG